MTALVMMIAPPAGGKTTWAEARFTPTQRVSLDRFRALVSDDEEDQDATPDAVQVQHLIVAARCRRRRLTVVDATNTRGSLRRTLLRHAVDNQLLTVAVVLDTSLDICKAQNLARQAAGGRFVPPDVIERMWTSMQENIPAGPIPDFDVTRRIGPDHDQLFGATRDQYEGAAWLL